MKIFYIVDRDERGLGFIRAHSRLSAKMKLDQLRTNKKYKNAKIYTPRVMYRE